MKYIKSIFGVVLMAILIVSATSCNGKKTTYQINDVELQDSILHQNVFEKTVGIPTITEMRYCYKLKLSNDKADTTLIIITRFKINKEEVVGDSIAIY